jgi:hypothetical protein
VVIKLATSIVNVVVAVIAFEGLIAASIIDVVVAAIVFKGLSAMEAFMVI